MKAAIISLLCALATSVCIVMFSEQAASQPEQHSNLAKRIDSLLTERRDTLLHILQWVESRYSQGESELDHVIQARNNLLDAELDIAKTNAERVGIREQQVNNYRDLENVLTQRHKNGEMVSVEILVVKAVRLKAEIQLLRE